MEKEVVVIGAGLAGSEAAYQLAKRGIKVKLYEMKPVKFSEVHKLEGFAELVCSNSLGSFDSANASGLMKEEVKRLGSLIVECAYATKVPAGQALAVDRDLFSEMITKKLESMENIEIIRDECVEIDTDKFTVVATGPLSSEGIANRIKELTGEDYLYFYDAVAPILTRESIDFNIVYEASRYDKGEGEYINCPMSKEQYQNFYRELMNSEKIEMKSFEKVKLFEACMPVEKIAESGERSLLFGPLKPKGLTNPQTGREDYAVIQLRQDNMEGTLYNMVGFQTNLKWGEQKRVFSMIPGLENADFIRYGVMHRNTFINSTKLLNPELNMKKHDKIYFAGQITGSEGYAAAIATGFMAGVNIANRLNGKEPVVFEDITMTGALIKYITTECKNFQPMGPNFGIIRAIEERIRDKKEKYRTLAKRSLEYIESVKHIAE